MDGEMSMAKPRAHSPPTNGPVASGRQRSHRDRASLLINDSPSLIDRRRNRSGVGMDTIAELEKVRQGLVRNLVALSALGNRTGGSPAYDLLATRLCSIQFVRASIQSIPAQVGSWHTPQKMRLVPQQPPQSMRCAMCL